MHKKNTPTGLWSRPTETIGDGARRPFTKLHYFSGALRLGYQINEYWRVDIRGEQFQAKDVESPGELSSGSAEASTKDVDRQALDVSLSGRIGRHSPSGESFYFGRKYKNYTQNVSGKAVVPFWSAQGRNAWKGIQVKDVWKLGRHSVILGYDYFQCFYQKPPLDQRHHRTRSSCSRNMR